MFLPREKKALKELLSFAVNPEEALSLDAFHGYLVGLAITPEMIMPSEWLPEVFGEEMFAFPDDKDSEVLMAELFGTYNRIISLGRDDKPLFPFDYRTLKNSDVSRIREWALGLFIATNLRPHLWGMGEDALELGDDEEDDEIAGAFAVIMGVAFPERIPELFEREEGNESFLSIDDPELEAKLFSLLPESIEALRTYAGKKEGGAPNNIRNVVQSQRTVKIGRNDPCPCGSGKKYKKCCL